MWEVTLACSSCSTSFKIPTHVVSRGRKGGKLLELFVIAVRSAQPAKPQPNKYNNQAKILLAQIKTRCTFTFTVGQLEEWRLKAGETEQIYTNTANLPPKILEKLSFVSWNNSLMNICGWRIIGDYFFFLLAQSCCCWNLVISLPPLMELANNVVEIQW